jgi:hypothetical protein
MLRRWRQELARHGFEVGQPYPWCALAPPGDAEGIDCHCARGIGSMRKMRPFGCSKGRTCICRWHKNHYVLKRHAGKFRTELAYEWAATGGW